jgi:hypothetical protein
VHSAFKIRKIRAKRAPQIPAILAIMAILAIPPSHRLFNPAQLVAGLTPDFPILTGISAELTLGLQL